MIYFPFRFEDIMPFNLLPRRQDKTPEEQFDPDYKHSDEPYEKYHALYGNNEESRVVLIGKNPEETKEIHRNITERLKAKVNQITWILEPYHDRMRPAPRDWAKFMKEEHATNVLIQTGDPSTDGEIFDELRKAYLIPTVALQDVWK